MSEPVSLKYRAFISYSHADAGWARWLHRGLESFRIDKDLAGRRTATGVIPNALRPVFRDRDDFTAGHTLTEQTLAALDASHALIVICSPSSAKSLYVNEEIRLFKSRHPDRPVIPLIVGGEPGDAQLECFPPALKFKLDAKGRVTKKRIEVLAADAREEGDGKDLAIAKVIAGLLGVSSDEVFRRAERERRAAMRRKRRVQAIVAGLALLLAAGGVVWLNQDYLKEQYYWRFVMGPTVLTAAEERALKPGDEFSECKRGCPTMVVVPAGKFMMGSPEEEGDERPQHEVTIAKPFAVGKYEVTVAEWEACVAASGCPSSFDTASRRRGNWPKTNLTWEENKLYAAWLSGLAGKTYRLLSEAEWEYAVRGGTTTRYFFGNDAGELRDYAWTDTTRQVGQKKPNPFGLYDMLGNVGERVEDRYHVYYDGAPSDGSAWLEGESAASVIRGGSTYVPDSIEPYRSAYRGFSNAETRYLNEGFRVARTIDQ